MARQLWCTESNCQRLAVVTVINTQTGSGGHLCEDHAVMWAAGFIMAHAGAKAAEHRDAPPVTILRGKIKEPNSNG